MQRVLFLPFGLTSFLVQEVGAGSGTMRDRSFRGFNSPILPPAQEETAVSIFVIEFVDDEG